jgi:P27 family predicted phage terminase small subunit
LGDWRTVPPTEHVEAVSANPGGTIVRQRTAVSFGTETGIDRAKPPAHLSRQSKRWWRSVLDVYELEAHHVAILTAAAEAWDRKEEARLVIAEEGVVIRAGGSSPMPHPAVQVEDVAAMRFAQLVREIGLDGASNPDVRLR